MTKRRRGLKEIKAPDNGKRIIGSKEVTAIGIASVIHQKAIHNVDAKTALASFDNPSGFKKSLIRINNKGPKKRPIFFEFIIWFISNYN